MQNFDISIASCADYSETEVNRALDEALSAIGGLDWVEAGMTVAIKANLVMFLKPERAATTHPSLLCALVKRLRDRGAEVVLGDSPGGLYNAAYVGRVYAATGMHLVEQAGAKLNDDYSQVTVDYPSAKIAKRLTYTAYLDKADAIINFCKLKSHGMMGMSAAAKNMFGVVPGTMKPEYHFRYPSYEAFADMILGESASMAEAYAQAGIENAVLEKVTVNYLGEERVAIRTSATIQGYPYYLLQVFEHDIGQYYVTITFSSLFEDTTQSMLDLFYKLN